MDFARLFSRTWALFTRDLVALVVFALAGLVLGLTIIAIPLVTVTFVRSTIRYVREGRRPEPTDLWELRDVGRMCLLVITSGIAIAIGLRLLIVPGVVLATWWLYAGHLLVDQHLGVWAALEASRHAVTRTGFMNHMVALILLLLLTGLGASIAGLGTLVTTPLALLFLTLAYEERIRPAATGLLEAGDATSPPR